MYVRVYEGLGQPPEILRDVEEEKRRFVMAKGGTREATSPFTARYFTARCIKTGGVEDNDKGEQINSFTSSKRSGS